MSDIMNGVDAVIGSIYMVLLVFVCAWFITNLALAVIYEQACGPVAPHSPPRVPRARPRPEPSPPAGTDVRQCSRPLGPPTALLRVRRSPRC